MENKKESTEMLFRHLLLRRCTDAEREKAETRALNGPTKEHLVRNEHKAERDDTEQHEQAGNDG